MNTEQLYVELKPLLFSLAYQMLGSVTDAEDIVQDAFITLHEEEPVNIKFMKAYMCKIVTNKCLNKLKSASKQREMYVGPWLPEPLIANGLQTNDPLHLYISKESLSTAYLLLLQQLSSMERIVFLLRELFHYSFQDIAVIVDKSSGNCRQIYFRAKGSIGSVSGKEIPPVERTNVITEQFANALMTGNLDKLLEILSKDAILHMDGGGKANAALRPIIGQHLVVRYFTGIRPKVPANFTCEVLRINGSPGIAIKVGKLTFSVITFQIKGHVISDVYIVMNPDKLHHLHK
ncbi:RNA polymerase sigma-70 factor [Paenibacillus sp. L3-i20]|uniref:RNA polymerase sigma-70 factor n=1 Tax=Paenibacillus sp. L3-i20 TaxID=2905833 RepID=UPI001EDE3429|nr:RNA polymerase sigma-70 factor [Paenibacillus sp. L3-i20]GKU80069.1 RNA polymerase sigma factor SigJ [Paenibacillus sp. L3-i20]